MKQLLLKKGAVLVENVPAPALGPSKILVEVSRSLISTGTEVATVQQSGTSIADRIKNRPQDLLKAFHSIKVRGVKRTLEIIQGKFEEWNALGYSCSGRVLAVGENVTSFQVGDRVACAGASMANHAEVVSIPVNLAVKIPQSVNDQSAAFVTIGAIAMQGVRRADVRLGETVAVIGLGLIGQVTVQLLMAAGCRVIGIDTDQKRVDRAWGGGLAAGGTSVSGVQHEALQLTAGMGVDATILTASTASSEPVNQAFEITRKKGRIVVVGAVGMDLKRSPFYEKEQDFLISCSYGPGRYDSTYEQGGHDYPYAYVRWTENRNMESFINLIAEGKIAVENLIEKEFPIDEAPKAYELLSQTTGAKPLAIVIRFPENEQSVKIQTKVQLSGHMNGGKKIRLGLIGVGDFTKAVHVPNLKAMPEKFEVAGVCVSSSASALTLGKQLGSSIITSDYNELLKDPSIEAVLIATRHDSHAAIAEAAIRAGKHVYLEKPLALTQKELDLIGKALEAAGGKNVFMVGFNRRFAPLTEELEKALEGRTSPLVGLYRINAGALPPNHWTKTAQGGGRLRGEACHMIDFFQAVTGSAIKAVTLSTIQAGASAPSRPDENFSADFIFEDGSLCTLVYTSMGHSSVSKERVEFHWAGKTAVLDDFSQLTVAGMNRTILAAQQDKGHSNALSVFYKAINSANAFPIPWQQLAATTQAAIELDAEAWGHVSGNA